MAGVYRAVALGSDFGASLRPLIASAVGLVLVPSGPHAQPRNAATPQRRNP